MSRLSNHTYRNGFTLIEVLFSLMIIFLIIYSFTSILKLIYFEPSISSNQIYLGIIQLREELLDVDIVETNEQQLIYLKEDQTFILQSSHDYLIKQPGTDIVLREIKNMYFEVINSKIYLCFEYCDKNYSFLIAYESI